VDGTRLLAEGRPGALAVIAAAPAGTMFDPGPCVYMEKLVVGPEAAGVVDLDRPLGENLAEVAKATGREVRDLTVIMLDRDRHEEAKRQVREVGARLQLITDGDVAGGILAAWDERPEVDLLYGIGGTPEGVVTACAVKALGGEHLGRLWPRNDEERQAALDAGYDLDQVLTADELVASDDCFFALHGHHPRAAGARGCSSRARVRSPRTLVMRGKSGTVRLITARHRFEKLRQYANIAY
jgi:fructose-1,6-bisphosphatase II